MAGKKPKKISDDLKTCLLREVKARLHVSPIRKDQIRERFKGDRVRIPIIIDGVWDFLDYDIVTDKLLALTVQVYRGKPKNCTRAFWEQSVYGKEKDIERVEIDLRKVDWDAIDVSDLLDQPWAWGREKV